MTPHYLHIFNSRDDYSSQNLVNFPTDSEKQPLFYGDSTMAGGVRGWYYGLWSGYYPWNPDFLGVGSTNENGESRPPFSITMTPNLGTDAKVQISESGREKKIAISPDAWIGNVSSYSDARPRRSVNKHGRIYFCSVHLQG